MRIEKIDISIIIPLYKGNKFCNRLLRLIEKNCLYKKLYKSCSIEVIFVNDYPQEEIVFRNDEEIFTVHTISHKKNQGIHAARVTGIKNARGQFIIMLDQDDLVKDNWLYSQWNFIQESQSEICLCNGWDGRFRLLNGNEEFEQRVNDVNSFFTKGNPVMSPGQAIIKKNCIPYEWMDNIQRVNGADDFLLWIMMKKRGCNFAVNKKYLYYHSPERTKDSVSSKTMINSLKEARNILSDIGSFLSMQEIRDFNRYIELRESKEIYDECPKDTKILHIIKSWLDLKNHGIDISSFFEEKKYNHIAIYGFGDIGESLFYELHNSSIHIDYAIDVNRNLKDFEEKLTILGWEDKFYNVDAVILTVVNHSEEIIERLREKIDCPIITMQDIILDIQSNLSLEL